MWVGGDGPQSEELRERFAHDERIEWLGRISDEERAARMRGCTVYCSPSVRGESFGMVLLEAMASGCALVASDLDGHRNVATDGVDALLAPVGDAAALAKALRRVLDDDAPAGGAGGGGPSPGRPALDGAPRRALRGDLRAGHRRPPLVPPEGAVARVVATYGKE